MSSFSTSSTEAIADRALRAPAPRELRQRLQRRCDAAAIGGERPKGSRAYILRACEPQPIEALLVGKARIQACSPFTLILLPDFRLGAFEKPGDVGAMLEPDQR